MFVFVYVSLEVNDFNKCPTSTNLLWKKIQTDHGLVACRMFQHSSNNNILPVSSWYYSLWALSLCKLWSLYVTISLFPTHSRLTPLLTFLPFSSLPVSSVGCLYMSETKQTESCVTPCSWETGGPQMSTAASSFVGHVRHSPDIS